MVDAKKQRFGSQDLREVFAEASKVVAMKGKKITTFNMKATPPDPEEFAKAVMGPSGNLRAPTLKVGKTFVVGFNAEGYEAIFG